MKTAMQELIEDFTELAKKEGDSGFVGRSVLSIIKNKKYLEKEKEQIIDAGNSCALKQHLHNDRINKMSESEIRQFAEEEHLTFGEEYYNETYKK